jgi:hypothetical protein
MLRKSLIPESRSGVKYATPEYGLEALWLKDIASQ